MSFEVIRAQVVRLLTWVSKKWPPSISVTKLVGYVKACVRGSSMLFNCPKQEEYMVYFANNSLPEPRGRHLTYNVRGWLLSVTLHVDEQGQPETAGSLKASNCGRCQNSLHMFPSLSNSFYMNYTRIEHGVWNIKMEGEYSQSSKSSWPSSKYKDRPAKWNGVEYCFYKYVINIPSVII